MLPVALSAGLLAGPGRLSTARVARAFQESSDQEQVTIAFSSELNTLDPAFFTSSNEQSVYYAVFDTLVTRDADLNIIPGLAESWTNPDDNTWEFKLRAGVTFHDGSPLTSDDVKFTVDRILGDFMENPSQSKLATIQEVQAVDPLTVRFITKSPDPILLARLAGIVGWIVPKAHIEATGFEDFATNPVGTGPYRFVSWTKDEELVLESNPAYWKGEPPYKRIVFRPVPEASTRLALLKSGDVDFIQDVPTDQVSAFEGDDTLQIISTPTLRTLYFILRSDEGPLTDVRVRQAMNYAIDKEGVISELLNGNGTVSPGQTMGPEYFGFNPELQPYPYDPEKAKALLAEAGFDGGQSIQLLTPSGRYQGDRTIAEAVAAQLSEVGITVEIEAVEFSVYVTRKLDRSIDPITLGAWSQPVYDADGVVYLLYHTDEPWGVHYSNPRVDELSEQARATLDPDARLSMYHEALAIIREDAPVIFMHQQTILSGAKTGSPVLAMPDESLIVFPKW
jgi:peptide/nickel transport system substrate-binding protein